MRNLLNALLVVIMPPLVMALMALLFTFDADVVMSSLKTADMWLLGLVLALVYYVVNYIYKQIID